MNEQPDLFDRAEPPRSLPYQRGSEASRDAARRAARNANDQHKRIMRWMDGRVDGTRSEMAEREPYGVGLPINVVTPRVHELVHRLKYLTEAGRGYLDRLMAGGA